MSYRLQPEEALPEGVKRIAREQLYEILAQLQAPEANLDEAVHESRKALKKLRGLLRLVRKEIGESAYKRENICFRDAGRLLADLRESAVMISTLDDLQEELAENGAVDEAMNQDIGTAREALVIFYHATRQRTVVEEEAVAQVIDSLNDALPRVPDWPVAEDAYTAVAGGLKKVYKRGRNRFQDVQSEDAASMELLHEWRKRVKYLWYNVRLLRPVWKQPMKALADEVHELANYLGDDHDLAELRDLLTTERLLKQEATQTALFHLIDRKRANLQANARCLGQHIYVEKPADFRDRLGVYWEAWRGQRELVAV